MSFLSSSVSTDDQVGSQNAGGRIAIAEARQSGPASGIAIRSRREIFPACANPHCDRGWLRLGRSRKVPVFEGGWCCSSACMERRIAAAARRELEAQGMTTKGHRHRIPLGLTMMEQGWISPEELRAALAAQRASGSGRLGLWLVRGRSATEEQVTRAIGLQWSCPVLAVELHRPESLTSLVPRLFVDAFGALPLRVAAGKIVYLGFEDRPDPVLALAVERMTGLHVETGVVAESEFRPAHDRLLRTRFPNADLIEAGTEAATVAALTAAVERARPVETRLVRVHDWQWLRMWLYPQPGSVPDPDSICDVLCSTASH